MAEIGSVFLGCLAAYTFAAFLLSESNQNPWLKSYGVLSLFLALLALGPLYALLLLVLGTGLALAFSYRREHFEPQASLRQAIWPGLAMIISLFIAYLFRWSLPLQSSLNVAPLFLGLFIALAIANLVIHRLDAKPWPPENTFYLQLGLSAATSLLAIYLSQAIAMAGPALFFVVMGVFAAQVLVLQRSERDALSLNRQTEEITLMRNLGDSMPNDLDDLLNTIFYYVNQVLDATIFYIAIHDEERETFDFRLVRLRGEAAVWESLPSDSPSAAKQVLQGKLPLRLHKVAEVPEVPAATVRGPALDYLGVPLIVNGHSVGVMAIISDKAHSLDTKELRVLQTIANQVALAVRNATLFARQTEQVEKLSLINKSVRQIMFNRNSDSALRVACPMAAEIANSEKAAIFLRQDDALVLQCVHGMTEVQEQWLRLHPAAIRDERHHVQNIAEAEDPAQIEAGQAVGFRALVEIPLRADQTTHGMLAIYYESVHYFRPRELDLLETLANQITAMLENVRLFGVMEEYATEMSQLIQLSRIATASMQLDQVLHDIAETLQQMLAVNRVTIYSLETGDPVVRLLANVNGGETVEDSPYTVFPELANLKPGATSRAYHQHEENLSDSLRQQMDRYSEQTAAVVPMVLKDRVLGAVLLGSKVTRQFAEREWQFIELATTQISAQINNIKLHEKILQDLNRRLAQIAVIEDVAQQVSSSLNFNTVIQHVLAAAMNAIDADLVSLGLVAENNQFWVMERRVEEGRARYRYMSQATDQGLLGQVFAQRKTLIVPDHSVAEHYVSDHEGIYRSSIAVPLIKEESVIGVLNGESVQLNAFQAEHASFLSRLAGHAVMSIENARFLESRQREIEMLRQLRELAVWLVSTDNTQAVAQRVLATALELLEGQAAILYHVQHESHALKSLSALSSDDTPAPEPYNPVAQQVGLQAVRVGEVEIVNDLEAQPGYDANAPVTYRSLLAIPLARSQQVQHVILVAFNHPRFLHAHDQDTIAMLAAQAVGHLENAELHERIRSGRDQMRTILDSTQDGMILLDREAHLVESNPAAQRLLGLHLETCIGKPFDEVLQQRRLAGEDAGYTASDIDNLLSTLRDTPEVITQRDLQRDDNGQPVYIEELGLPVRDTAQTITGRLLVLRDVTKSRLLEAQREDFTDMVVHDLRGPLGSIHNALDLALDNVGDPQSKEENRLLLQSSRQNASRLMRLVETLLDIAKMQSPDMALDCEPVSVQALVESAHAALLSSFQQAELRFVQDLPPDLPDVYVDREKILRVIINLLDNAVRYASAKGEVMISARVLEGDSWLELRVADSGDGIPQNLRDSIFDRFRRVPGKQPQRGHKGHGLGLSFSRQAIEKHGGTIQIVDDCSLSGACFALTLPVLKKPVE